MYLLGLVITSDKTNARPWSTTEKGFFFNSSKKVHSFLSPESIFSHSDFVMSYWSPGKKKRRMERLWTVEEEAFFGSGAWSGARSVGSKN